jgi:hypothetical protein
MLSLSPLLTKGGNATGFLRNASCRPATLVGKEICSLWEWLPATIKSLQDAAPTKKEINSFRSLI